MDVAKKFPDKLRLELNALVTRVLFDSGNRAIGVEYLKGERLYRAHADPSSDPGEKHQIFASRETILCGGAFNTPQLLMLSGIGPKQELQRHGIQVRVDLPGVGKNLQDRYEVSVVNRMREDWKCMTGAAFDRGDPTMRRGREKKRSLYQQWRGARRHQKIASLTRSVPDLFCLGLLAEFKGYFPGYSKLIPRAPQLSQLGCLKGPYHQ